mgnify:CR=1 FL=1
MEELQLIDRAFYGYARSNNRHSMTTLGDRHISGWYLLSVSQESFVDDRSIIFYGSSRDLSCSGTGSELELFRRSFEIPQIMRRRVSMIPTMPTSVMSIH